MIVVISVTINLTVAAHSGFTGRWLWSKFEHKADSLIAKLKRSGRTVREIDV